MAGFATCTGKMWGAYRVLLGKRMGKKPLGTLSHKWGIILKRIFKKLVVSMDWIDVGQGTDMWQAVWTRRWTFGFLKMPGIYWLSEQLLASEEGLFSKEVVRYVVSDLGVMCSWEIRFSWICFMKSRCLFSDKDVFYFKSLYQLQLVILWGTGGWEFGGVPQKGEVASVVLKLVWNLRYRNQSRITGLIQFAVPHERIIRISIAFPLYVSQSGMVMLSVLEYFYNEFCFH